MAERRQTPTALRQLIGAATLAVISLIAAIAPSAHAAAPTNDDATGAQPINNAMPQTFVADFEGATAGEHESPASRGQVWYRWTADASELVRIDACDRDSPMPPLEARLYAGDASSPSLVAEASGLGCHEEDLRHALIEGERYLLALGVRAFSGAEQTSARLFLRTSSPPENDLPEDAAPLLGSVPLRVSGHNVGATRDPGLPGGRTVWYSWRAPADAAFSIDACSEASTIDPGIEIWQGGAGGYEQRFTGGVSGCAEPGSRLTHSFEAGQSYLIRFRDGETPGGGFFEFTISQADPPSNDDYAAARRLRSRFPVGFAGTTEDATAEPRPDYTRAQRYGDVWYRWTAPFDGRAGLTCSRALEVTVLDLDRAGGTSDQRSQGCNPFWGPVTFGHQDGHTYAIAVSEQEAGRRTAAPEGAFSLRLDSGVSPFRFAGTAVAARHPNARARTPSLPISRSPAAALRSVASLPLGRFGDIGGGIVKAAGELQLSVCLGSGGRDCVGPRYRYDPEIRAQLILASDADAVDGKSLSGAQKRRCTQSQPARNHHCVLALGFAGGKIPTGRNAPSCMDDRSCTVNLVAGAHHPSAGPGDRVVVGGQKGGKIDDRAKTRVSAALYFARRLARRKPKTDRRPRRRRIGVVRAGRSPKLRSVYSVRIKRPRAGERLVVEGKYRGAIGHLPYNTRTRTGVVLSSKPTGTGTRSKRARRVAATPTRISDENNFNCTRGSSGHRTPCPIRKVGIVEFARSSKKPVYVNLLAGHGAIGAGSDRWRSAHDAKVRRGFLKVRRYRPDECLGGGRVGPPEPGKCPRPR